MRVWHYTIGQHIPSILEDGKIKKEENLKLKKQNVRVVWFSINPIWEETANKMIQDKNGNLQSGTEETTHLIGGGLARIEVFPEVAPYTWADYSRKSKANKRYLDSLESIALKQGANPEEWTISYKNIPKTKWLVIEAWDSQMDSWIDAVEFIEKKKEILQIGGESWEYWHNARFVKPDSQ